MTKDDQDSLVEYGEFFWQQTPYVTTGMEYNPDAVRGLLELLEDEHYLQIHKIDGKIVGFLGAFLTPLHFNPKYIMASEVFFFVDPELREKGLGQQMLKKAEQELKERGACMLTMGEMRSSKDMGTFYSNEGYVLTERSFTKVI